MSGSKSKPLVRLKIILVTPPPGVDFCLQKGKGNVFGRIQLQKSNGGDLLFEFEAGIKKTPEGEPDFNGEFVQGPLRERFIYINIGASAGQLSSPWNRRLKIPLRGFNWKELENASANPDIYFETRVPGTARDGSPTCATIKPFEGWKLIRR